MWASLSRIATKPPARSRLLSNAAAVASGRSWCPAAGFARSTGTSAEDEPAPPPRELHSLVTMATRAAKQGELSKAAFLYELALHGWLASVAADSPDVDRTRTSLAAVCEELQQHSKASWALAAGTEDEPEYPAEGCHKHNFLPPPPLRNRYIAVRHGQSTANVTGLISSDPAVATVTHGLTDLGRKQAAAAVAELAESGNRKLAIFTSDFTRARETADLLVEGLRTHPAQQELSFAPLGLAIETRLRERWFGELDGTSDKPLCGATTSTDQSEEHSPLHSELQSLGGYEAVWKNDLALGEHDKFGCESVYSVLGRVTELIAYLEAEATRAGVHADDGAAVVLVAHGDVLQILQAGFEGIDARRHRSLPHLPNATPRLLIRRRNRPIPPTGCVVPFITNGQVA